MQKEVGSYEFLKTSETIFQDSFFDIGRNSWSGEFAQNPVFHVIQTPNLSDQIREYGVDVVRISQLISPNGSAETLHLESGWRWLSSVFDLAMGLRSSRKLWNASPWLLAAFSARDHLLLRKKPYSAFASIRKAWKRSPLSPLTPPHGRNLILSLLFPFSPIVSLWLGNHFERADDNKNIEEQPSPWKPVSIENETAFFKDLQAIRVSVEKGGWHWEIVDSSKFSSNPRSFFSQLQWVKKAFGESRWTVKHQEAGWKLYFLPDDMIQISSITPAP